MKKFSLLLSTVLSLVLIISCSAVDEGGDASKTPIEHTGIVYDSDLTIHGRVQHDEVDENYARIPTSIVESSTDADFANTGRIKEGGLHLDNAGYYVAFSTDSSKVNVFASLRKVGSTPNVPDANENGFQLLVLKNGEYEDTKATISDTSGTETSSTLSYTTSDTATNQYILLYPTYNGVKEGTKVSITIDTDAVIYNENPFNENKELPIVIYGTSVTQGASGSTPRSNYTSILSFELKREVINLGFSGSAYFYGDMQDFLVTVPAKVMIIDPSLNFRSGSSAVSSTQAKANVLCFYTKYRTKYPKTPIVMVSEFKHDNYKGTDNSANSEGYGVYLQETYNAKKDGDPYLYWVSTYDIDSYYWDGVAYGSVDNEDDDLYDTYHPNDNGMRKIADAYLKTLNEIL